jgi:hypothetical protein
VGTVTARNGGGGVGARELQTAARVAVRGGANGGRRRVRAARAKARGCKRRRRDGGGGVRVTEGGKTEDVGGDAGARKTYDMWTP